MANPRPKHKFKKGVVTNPNGRPPDPPELKEIKKLTKGELAILFNKVLHSKPDELNNFNGTVLEKWLASIVFHGIKSGDFSRLHPFIDRLLGKVPDKIEVSEVESMSDEDLLSAAEEALMSMREKLKK